MMISEIDEVVSDYDWFAADKEGRIGFFTTGGIGNLPRAVAASSDDLRFITDFIRKTLSPSTEARLAPKAREAANNEKWRKGWSGPMDAEAAIAHCFQDWMQMASRGVYSFDYSCALDCTRARIRPCPLYNRIAIPSTPLHVTDLPMNVRTILGRNVLVGAAFSKDDEVHVE